MSIYGWFNGAMEYADCKSAGFSHWDFVRENWKFFGITEQDIQQTQVEDSVLCAMSLYDLAMLNGGVRVTSCGGDAPCRLSFEGWTETFKDSYKLQKLKDYAEENNMQAFFEPRKLK